MDAARGGPLAIHSRAEGGAGIDNVKRGGGDRLERVDGRVIPSRVRRAGDEEVTAIVGHDHAIPLQCATDDAGLGGVQRGARIA